MSGIVCSKRSFDKLNQIDIDVSHIIYFIDDEICYSRDEYRGLINSIRNYGYSMIIKTPSLETTNIEGLELFNINDAREILDFLSSGLLENLIIGCRDGLTRSLAVGKFLNDFNIINCIYIETDSKNPTIYNKLIYDKLKEAYSEVNMVVNK